MALAQVTTAWSYEGVPSYLHQPIHPVANASQQVRASVMAALTVLEVQLATSMNNPSGATAPFTPAHLQTSIDEIVNAFLLPPRLAKTKLGEDKTTAMLIEWMTTHEVAPFFPKLADHLQLPLHALNDIHEYLGQLALINQTASLAFQLKADIDFINHKYMAHQIALLFLALGQLNSPLFTTFKQRIEAEFEAIKAASSAETDTPQLSAEQKAWLHTLTEDIINMALSCPIELGGALVKVADNMIKK